MDLPWLSIDVGLIDFDRIIGWEMKKIDHADVWRGRDGYPAELHSRVTYYNTPVSSDPASGDNPLTHIAELAKPDDYVVFKLDIDHSELELELIRQVRSPHDLPMSSPLHDLPWPSIDF